MIAPLPGFAFEAAGSGRLRRERSVGVVLKGLEGGADAVAQSREPGGRFGLQAGDFSGTGGHGHGRFAAHPYPRGGQERVCLSQRFAEDHGSRDGNVERARARPHGHVDAGVGRLVHLGGNARRFPAEQEDVVAREGEIRIGEGAFRGRENEAMPTRRPPFLESPPRAVARDLDAVEVIEPGAAEIAVGDVEPGRLDDVDRHA